MGRAARVSLRVNPDVDARTHKKISTGLAENKFGVPLSRAREVYACAAKLPGIEIAGADMHIGSQLTDLAPFDEAFSLLAELVRDLRADGHEISHVDLGGGLGIPYHEGDDPQSYHPDDYAEIVRRHFGALGCKLVFEPGRLIVGNAGVLITRVIYVKHGDAKTFVIVDAGMNDLVRPTLYDAWHDIIPVRESADRPKILADIVGPVCETGDYLALGREMPEPRPGELLAVLTAGAYGAVQAGTYNTRPLIPEVLVDGARFAVIRKRRKRRRNHRARQRSGLAGLTARPHLPLEGGGRPPKAGRGEAKAHNVGRSSIDHPTPHCFAMRPSPRRGG